MANSSGDYQYNYRLFGVDRSNFKYDFLAFMIVAGLVALLVVIILADFHLLWINQGNKGAKP
jgi:hypothetical protein